MEGRLTLLLIGDGDLNTDEFRWCLAPFHGPAQLSYAQEGSLKRATFARIASHIENRLTAVSTVSTAFAR